MLFCALVFILYNHHLARFQRQLKIETNCFPSERSSELTLSRRFLLGPCPIDTVVMLLVFLATFQIWPLRGFYVPIPERADIFKESVLH